MQRCFFIISKLLNILISRAELEPISAVGRWKDKTCDAMSTRVCGTRGPCGRPARPVAEAATSTDTVSTHVPTSGRSKKCDAIRLPARMDSGECGRNVPDRATEAPDTAHAHTLADLMIKSRLPDADQAELTPSGLSGLPAQCKPLIII